MTTTTTVAGEELREYTERHERIEAQKQECSEMQKELKAEMKGKGYDMPAFTAVLARRKKDRDEVADLDAKIDLYEATLEGV